LIELAIILIYAFTIQYEELTTFDAITPLTNDLPIYGYFRDVNIMIFFGFGFLMTFLRRYAYSAVGYVLLISSIVVQLAVLVRALFYAANGTAIAVANYYPLGLYQLIDGLFCAGAGMISFGGIIGKVNPTQLLVLAVLEPFFYFANASFLTHTITVDGESVAYAHDIGGGMVIHTFGAYFGLAVTWWITNNETRYHKDNVSNYAGDVFSLAGTILLWLLWPSFNAAVTLTPSAANRAVVNTFLSISASVLSAFAVSRLLDDWKFDVVHIQNSTLAGGVAMGVAADLQIGAHWALVAGFVAGGVSVVGYKYVTPFLSKRLRIQDVCGIHNLHGMPGVISSMVGVIAAASIKPVTSGNDTTPAMSPERQLAAFGVTLGLAIFGGIMTGALIRLVGGIRKIIAINYFNDRTFWNLPSDYDWIADDERT